MNMSFIRVYHAEDYRFIVYPRNHHNNPLATSAKAYISEHACRKAMESFARYVIKHDLSAEDGQRVKVLKENNDYCFQYFDDQGKCLVISAKSYSTKSSCRKAIQRVYLSIKESI